MFKINSLENPAKYKKKKFLKRILEILIAFLRFKNHAVLEVKMYHYKKYEFKQYINCLNAT